MRRGRRGFIQATILVFLAAPATARIISSQSHACFLDLFSFDVLPGTFESIVQSTRGTGPAKALMEQARETRNIIDGQFGTAADSIRFINRQDFIDMQAFPVASIPLAVG